MGSVLEREATHSPPPPPPTAATATATTLLLCEHLEQDVRIDAAHTSSAVPVSSLRERVN